jgi:hypothetical protein
MAGRADFTEEEWEALRRGVTGAGLLVSASDSSFFDTFKEAGAFAKHIAAGREQSSELVRDLSGERGTGFSFRTSTEELEQETMSALREARSLLEAKAPDELGAYRAFVVEVAESVASATGGGEDQERGTIERIRAALGTDSA